MRTPTIGRRLAVALLLTALVSVAGATVVFAQDTHEPNDSAAGATPIDPGQEVEASIDTRYDEDWYVLDVRRGQSVEVTLSVDGDARRSVDVELSGERWNVPFRFTDKRVAPGETRTTGAIATDSRVYLRVESSDNLAAGGYSLNASVNDTDDFEPNQDQNSATPIERDQEVRGEITLNDWDWFTVPDVQRGQAIDVTFSVGEDASDEMDITVRGPNDEYTGSTDVEPGETGTASGISESSGDYYVEVGPGVRETGSYSFRVSTTDTDEFEPNQGPRSAATAPLDEGVRAELTDTDNDWYSCGCLRDVQRGQTIDATLSVAENASGAMEVRIFDRNREFVASRSVEPGEAGTVSATAEYSGLYYVQVYSPSGATGQYGLNATASGSGPSDPTDEYEPNEFLESATLLESSTQKSGILTRRDDRDWFRVPDVRAGETVSLTLSVPGSATDGMNVTVYTPDETDIGSRFAAPGRDRTVTFRANQSGAYYFSVTHQTNSVDDYSVGATVSGEPDRYEPNDRPESASEIELGTPANSTILPGGEDDWYVLHDVPAGRYLEVTVTFADDATRQVYIELYQAGSFDRDVGWGSVYPGSTDTLARLVERNGTYYVRVTTYQRRGSGDYTVVATAEEIDPYEPNQDRANASVADLGSGIDAELRPSDWDWYTCDCLRDVEAGQVVNATLSVDEEAYYGMYARLYGPDGGFLGSEFVEPGTTGSVSGLVNQAGAHYVLVYGSAGSYSLRTDVTAGPPPDEPFARLTFRDNVNDGEYMWIDGVSLSEGGFVAIYNESGALVGVSDYLTSRPRSSVEVEVPFFEELTGTRTLTAVAHRDTDEDREFDPDADAPYTRNGEPVADSAKATIPEPRRYGPSNVTFEDQAFDGRTLTVEEVNISEGGFVVVRSRSGVVRGHSTYLEPGLHEEVVVSVDRPFMVSQRVNATLVRDVDADRTFDPAEAYRPYSAYGGGRVTDDAMIYVDEPAPRKPLVFDDQTSDGRNVTVRSVDMPRSGFVVVTSDDGDDRVLGVSDYLEAGLHENVTVTLDEPLTEDQTLVAIAQADVNNNREYDADRVVDFCRFRIHHDLHMDDADVNVSG